MGTVIEHRIAVATPPDRVYRLYADVANWHRWDPDTRSASLDGPFAVGSRGRLTPARGHTVPMEVTRADPARGFTVESRMPLLRIVFEHELWPRSAAETQVVHRVTLTGPLSWLIGPLFKRRLDQGLPVTLARLKRMVESGSPD